MENVDKDARSAGKAHNRAWYVALVSLAALIALGLVTLTVIAELLPTGVELEIKKAGLTVTIVGGLGFFLVLFRVFFTSYTKLVALFVTLSLIFVAVELTFVEDESYTEASVATEEAPDEPSPVRDAPNSEAIEGRLAALSGEIDELLAINEQLVDSFRAASGPPRALESPDRRAVGAAPENERMLAELQEFSEAFAEREQAANERLLDEIRAVREDVAELEADVREIAQDQYRNR